VRKRREAVYGLKLFSVVVPSCLKAGTTRDA